MDLENADNERDEKKCCKCNPWSKCVYKAKCECSRSNHPCTNCPSKSCKNDEEHRNRKEAEREARNAGGQRREVKEATVPAQSVAAEEIAPFEEEESEVELSSEEESLARRQYLALQRRVEVLEREKATLRKDFGKELKAASDLVMTLSRSLQSEAKSVRVLEERVMSLEQQLQGTNQLVSELLERLNKKEDRGQLRRLEGDEKAGVAEKEDKARKRAREADSDCDDPLQPLGMDVDLQEENQQLPAESKDAANGPNSPKKPRVATHREQAIKKPERSTDEEWEEKRKKTVILKGLSNPSRTAVVSFLVKYGFAKEQEVVKVESRKVNSQEWTFIQFTSVRIVDHIILSKGKKLRNTSFFMQRDLSKAARTKQREERLKRKAQPPQVLKGVHPQRQAQITWPPQADRSQQSIVSHNQPQQAVMQTPAAALPNGQHNLPQFPNGRMVGAPLQTGTQQFPFFVRPGNQYQINAGLLPLYNPPSLYSPAPVHPSGWAC